MASPSNPKEFVVKTAEEIRNDYLRTIREGLINRGIPNPNVSEGTYDYIKGTALGDFGALIYNNLQAKANAQMPDTALGDDLVRIAKIYGLDLRPAGISTGIISFTASVITPIGIPTGAQLIDDNGLSYEVSIGGNYDATQTIPVQSVDTGVATNLAFGATLRWTSPPPFVDQVATVADSGLTGGVDAETIEGLRTRLLEYLRNPPGGGNWSQVNLIAENASTAVEKAFTYPAVYGPATFHTAAIRATTATNKNRDVDSIIISTLVGPNVAGEFPQFADATVTTVVNEPADVSIGLDIPFAKTASPAGEGGGWLDGNIFPTKTSVGYVEVTAVNNSDDIQILSPDLSPYLGARIVYVSPTNWKIYHATVIGGNWVGPNYQLLLDKGLFRDDSTNTPIAVGDWIFPDAEQIDVYIEAILAAFASLGPGQKTNIASLLPRAYRKPLVKDSYPSDIAGKFLKNMFEGMGEEVKDYSFLYKSITSPTINLNYQEPPNILVPRNIGFYPIE